MRHLLLDVLDGVARVDFERHRLARRRPDEQLPRRGIRRQAESEDGGRKPPDERWEGKPFHARKSTTLQAAAKVRLYAGTAALVGCAS